MSLILRSIVASLAILAGIAFAGTAMAKDKIVFGTNWTAQAEHGGFYQAKAYGLYEKAGLEVEIKEGGPQVNVGALLVGGKLDAAMFGNSFGPLNMVKEGIPYVAVASTFQKDPQVLMAHKDAGFKTLADLKGTPILISSEARATYWQFLKVAYGYDDKQIRPYTYNIAPFLTDKKAVQQGYVTNEPFRAKEAGIDPQVFLLADHGYDTYSSLIVTSRKLVEERPDVMQRFIDATLQGWHDFLYGENSKAIAMIHAHNPDYPKGAAKQSIEAMKAYGLVRSGDAETLGVGAMTDARWKGFFDKMVKAGVYDASLDYKAAYTLQFINKGIGKK